MTSENALKTSSMPKKTRVMPFPVWIRRTLTKCIYVFVFLAYFVFVFKPGIQVGIVISLLFLAVFILNMPYKIKGIDWFVLLYAVWGVVSMAVAMMFGLVSIREIVSKYLAAYFPVLFFFVARKNKSVFNSKDFFHYLLIALIFCFIAGLYWYIFEPGYYISYLERLNVSIDGYHLEKRFQSFIGGSIGVGLLSVIGFIVSIRKYSSSKKIMFLVFAFCMIVMGILTMQRSAYILLAFFALWNLFCIKKKKRLFVIIPLLIIFFVVAGAIVASRFPDIFELVAGRISKITFDSMIKSRSNQWSVVGGMGPAIFTGYGVGSLTDQAKNSINDGAFFNMIGEIGVVGFSLFLIIVAYVFLKSLETYKKNKYFLVCIMVCFAFLINSIGSNCILYMEASPIFWFSLGKLAMNKRKVVKK